MNDFVQMNVFFLISSVAAVLFMILGVILLIYLISFVKDLKYISRRARIESDHIVEDIDKLRAKVKDEGFKTIHVASFVKNIYSKFKKGNKHAKQK